MGNIFLKSVTSEDGTWYKWFSNHGFKKGLLCRSPAFSFYSVETEPKRVYINGGRLPFRLRAKDWLWVVLSLHANPPFTSKLSLFPTEHFIPKTDSKFHF